MLQRSRSLAAALLLCAALQAHAGYRIDWYAIAGGGTPVAANAYQLDGTIGQALAGPSCSAGTDCATADWQLTSGYWTVAPCDTTPDVVFCDAFDG